MIGHARWGAIGVRCFATIEAFANEGMEFRFWPNVRIQIDAVLLWRGYFSSEVRYRRKFTLKLTDMAYLHIVLSEPGWGGF